jgi:hypothetical protein
MSWWMSRSFPRDSGEKILVDYQFSTFGVFDKPLVRIRTPTKNKDTIIPVNPKAHRTVKDVNGGNKLIVPRQTL